MQSFYLVKLSYPPKRSKFAAHKWLRRGCQALVRTLRTAKKKNIWKFVSLRVTCTKTFHSSLLKSEAVLWLRLERMKGHCFQSQNKLYGLFVRHNFLSVTRKRILFYAYMIDNFSFCYEIFSTIFYNTISIILNCIY